jgi:hypothetical protein
VGRIADSEDWLDEFHAQYSETGDTRWARRAYAYARDKGLEVPPWALAYFDRLVEAVRSVDVQAGKDDAKARQSGTSKKKNHAYIAKLAQSIEWRRPSDKPMRNQLLVARYNAMRRTHGVLKSRAMIAMEFRVDPKTVKRLTSGQSDQ